MFLEHFLISPHAECILQYVDTQNVVGVAIVTHNSGPFPELLLRSLFNSRTAVRLRVVIVDNGSERNQVEPIATFLRETKVPAHIEVKLLEEEQNLGFSGGTNRGIKWLFRDKTLDYVCLLNSDAVLTDFWIDRLLAHRVDVVSPVTNKSHSSQQIGVPSSIGRYEISERPQTKKYAKFLKNLSNFSENRFHTFRTFKRAADSTFFCTLVARRVFDQIGFLDEEFFPGGYEDNDFFERLRSAEIQPWIARDVYVHHWGSRSFSKIDPDLFALAKAKNLRHFSSKHGFVPDLPKFRTESFLEDFGHASMKKSQYWHYFILNFGQMLTEWPRSTFAITWTVFSSLVRRLFSGHQEGLSALKKSLLAIEGDMFRHTEFSRRFDVADSISKATAFLTHGVTYMRRIAQFNGVIVLGGYPHTDRLSDGYFQRIAQLEEALQPASNLYVEFKPKPTHPPASASSAWVIYLGGRSISYRVLSIISVLLCTLKSKAILSHSVLPISSYWMRALIRIAPRPFVIDLHGVVPEEFLLTGDPVNHARFNSIERFAIRRAVAVIAVSNNMIKHLKEKYGEPVGRKALLIPVVPGNDQTPKFESRKRIAGSVVYSGGLHPWQQPSLTMATLCGAPKGFKTYFYCPFPEEAQRLVPASCANSPIIRKLPHRELMEELEKIEFGLVLREENIVNLVASPTKLGEYISRGVIPILSTPIIGDFEQLGLQYIAVNEFRNSAIPTKRELLQMRNENLYILERMRVNAKEGSETLRGLLWK